MRRGGKGSTGGHDIVDQEHRSVMQPCGDECLVDIAGSCPWRQPGLGRAGSLSAQRHGVDGQPERPRKRPGDEKRLVVAAFGEPFIGERYRDHPVPRMPRGETCELALDDGGEGGGQCRTQCRLPIEFERAHDPVKRRRVGTEHHGAREGRGRGSAAFADWHERFDCALPATTDPAAKGRQTGFAPTRPACAPWQHPRAAGAGAREECIGGIQGECSKGARERWTVFEHPAIGARPPILRPQ